MRALTLRTKFVITFAVVAALSGILVGALTYLLTDRILRSDTDRTLATAATALAAGAPAAQISIDLQTISVGGSGTGHQQGVIQGAARLDPAGKLIQLVGVDIPVDQGDRGLLTAPAGSRRFRVSTVDGTDYRVLAQSLGAGRGVLLVAYDMSEDGRVLGKLRAITFVVTLVVVAVAGAVGALIAGRITRRLRSLTEAAETVSTTGDLEADIPASGTDEVSRLGGSIRGMLAELARSRADQQRLVQDAGHELRTPLTSLRTNVAVLRRFDELPPTARAQLLRDVEGETKELTSLVNELVQLAGGAVSGESPVLVDPAALAERVAQRFRRRSSRVITVQTDPETGVEPVLLSRLSVERALSNLVDNAIKFDPDGHAPIEITCGAVEFRVSDRGPGVDPTDAAHIFDRFYRATAARSLPGSGLGLAIVAEVAARHGGSPFVRARPGGGSVIGFTVAADESADAAGADRPAGAGSMRPPRA